MDPVAIPRATWKLDATQILGPAELYFAESIAAPADNSLSKIQHDHPQLEELARSVGVEDADEAGITEVSSSVFVIFGGDRLFAACGYSVWPGGVAHMSVLVDASLRGRGLGKRVALAVGHDAIATGLLLQWRARPLASQSLARSLGLEHVGTQVSINVGPRT